jgi:hypothetical protein
MGSDSPPNLHRKSLEKEKFQIDSSELTAELFLEWGLPAHYALAAGFHDDPSCIELGTGDTQHIAQLLNLSHQLAQICLHAPPTRPQLSIVEKTAEQFNIPEGEFGVIFDTIMAEWQEWGEMFEIRTSQCQLYDEIMSEENKER